MSLESEECDCGDFVPQVRRSHLCAECGGTRPLYEIVEKITRPSRPRSIDEILGPPPKRLELDLRSGHFGGASCTCFDCVMKRRVPACDPWDDHDHMRCP